MEKSEMVTKEVRFALSIGVLFIAFILTSMAYATTVCEVEFILPATEKGWCTEIYQPGPPDGGDWVGEEPTPTTTTEEPTPVEKYAEDPVVMGYQINPDGTYSNVGYDQITGEPYVGPAYDASNGFTTQSGENTVSQGAVTLGVNTDSQWTDVVDVYTEKTVGQAATWTSEASGHEGEIAVATTGDVSNPGYVDTSVSYDYDYDYSYDWSYDWGYDYWW